MKKNVNGNQSANTRTKSKQSMGNCLFAACFRWRKVLMTVSVSIAAALMCVSCTTPTSREISNMLKIHFDEKSPEYVWSSTEKVDFSEPSIIHVAGLTWHPSEVYADSETLDDFYENVARNTGVRLLDLNVAGVGHNIDKIAYIKVQIDTSILYFRPYKSSEEYGERGRTDPEELINYFTEGPLFLPVDILSGNGQTYIFQYCDADLKPLGLPFIAGKPLLIGKRVVFFERKNYPEDFSESVRKNQRQSI